MGDQTKAFLYAWCGKSKITPHYEVRNRGPKHSQHFLCECRIDGYDYVGVGKSTRKKEAQTFAARDFLLYLIRKGNILEEEVPEEILCPEDQSEGLLDSQDRPAGYHDKSAKKRRLDEAEDPDANAGIHGNWVLENAKARLHQFFQVNNIVAEYKYSQVGPDHNRSFICEMSFFSKKLGRSFSAREHGLNKQMASRSCALSLVRQLYHLQVIEAATGDAAKKGGDKLEPQEVTVEKSVVEELDAALESLQVQPAEIPKNIDPKVPFTLEFGRKSGAKNVDATTEEKVEAEAAEEMNTSEEKVEKSEENNADGSSEEKVEKPASDEADATTQEDEAEQQKPSVDDSKETEMEASSDKISTASKKDTEEVLDKEGSSEAQKVDENVAVEEEIEVIEQEEIIQWSPPQRNKNPWTNTTIGEGPFTKTLKQISTDLKKEYVRQSKTEALQKMLEERKKLSIWESRDELLENIKNNTSLIIRGATGCGKTTQVPQYILDSYLETGHGAECCIIVIQPRCLSAISIAQRVAEERSEDVGNSIGYCTRFESCLPRPYGSILFCTAAVMLKKLEYGFQGVSHIIVDEIQERDVNSDFIMMVLRDMAKQFPDIRIILMSTTIDTTIFHEYFSNCTVTEVKTTSHSVQEFFLEDCVQYLNFVPSVPAVSKKKKEDTEEAEESENLNKVIGDDYSESTKSTMTKLSEKELSFELIEAILTCIETLNIPGAILVFLPGWNTIASLMKSLQEHAVFSGPSYSILTLHSQMTLEELQRVYVPADEGVTKIILSTRIAEASITINNVVFVINSCKEEIKLFTPPNNLTSYTTMWASKRNLELRKQCASRNRAGFCFHLCSRARFEKLEDSVTPEICRTPLHELALAIRLHHLGYVGSYLGRALTPPPVDAILHSETVLKEIGALDKDKQVTSLGRVLAMLPVDPRVGKMILTSFLFSLGDPMCIVATHSSAFPEPFDTICPSRLTQVHQYFIGDRWSDHLTVLNAFVQWQGAHVLSKNAETSFCDQYSLSIPTMRAVCAAKNHLKKLFQDTEFPESCMQEQYYLFNGPDLKLDMIAALLIMGYYPNICYHLDFQKVVTKEDKSALIHHSSVNCTNQPPSFPSPFFVFGEKVQRMPVTCKRLTMVNPVHLLLFGCNKVELVNNEIRLDGWINLKMDTVVAAKILALRPALESLILELAANPDLVNELRPESQHLIDIVKKLCDRDAVTHRKYRVELPMQYVEPLPKKAKGTTEQAAKGTQGSKKGKGIAGGFDGNNMFNIPPGMQARMGFGRGMDLPPRGGLAPRGSLSGFMRGRGGLSGFGRSVFDEGPLGSGFGMGGIESRGLGFGMGNFMDTSDIGRGDQLNFGSGADNRDDMFLRRGRSGFGMGGGADDRDDTFLRRGRPGLNVGDDDRNDTFLRRGRPGLGMTGVQDNGEIDLFRRYRRGVGEDRGNILHRFRRGDDLSVGSARANRNDQLVDFLGNERYRSSGERDIQSFPLRGTSFGIGGGLEDRDESPSRFQRSNYGLGRNYEDNSAFRRDDSPLGFMGIRGRDNSPQSFGIGGGYGTAIDILDRDDSFPRSGSMGGGRMGIQGTSRDSFRSIPQRKSRDEYERGSFGRSLRQGGGRDFSDSDGEDVNDRNWRGGMRRSYR